LLVENTQQGLMILIVEWRLNWTKNSKIRVIWIFLRSKRSREGREGVRTNENVKCTWKCRVCVCVSLEVMKRSTTQIKTLFEPVTRKCRELKRTRSIKQTWGTNVAKFCKSWRMSNKLHAQSFFYKCHLLIFDCFCQKKSFDCLHKLHSWWKLL
jgi:hypothetical protein